MLERLLENWWIVIELTFGQVAEALGGELKFCDPQTLVSGAVETDSRSLVPGGIFFAKLGKELDGHDYLAEAFAKQAALSVVSRETTSQMPQIMVGDTVVALRDLAEFVLQKVRNLGELTVIGITGSNGKTSTKNMLAAILSGDAPTVYPRESFNNEVGLPLTVLKLALDTKYLILELGAAGLSSIHKLASWTRPDIGVQLKVGMAHVGEFGGIETTAIIKAEMMPFISKIAILNQDDPIVSGYRVEAGVASRSFGTSALSDYRILDVDISLQGTIVKFRYPDSEEVLVSLKILGEHQAMNMAAALAVADQLGIERTRAVLELEKLEMAERWRMQPIWTTSGALIINDAYNASPDSMKAALQTLAVIGRQGHRTIAVLGEMAELGPESRESHDAIGRLVVRYNIDMLFVVGEAAKLIHMGAMFEGSWDGESAYFDSISEAFEAISGKLAKGDVVLVKSSNLAGLRFLGDELAAMA
ncbi:UDP-N-acetylmuramoyl-tripeptide--D-alanyl-D-alanine ligase [Candidatus Aquiluna sp. UB-MaderosW2red]|nr:UDP-N-acetylmuramoyl-tripeptide--D-alanyl-D-alanine ligase [Candidatus Aquiluna sp. UB-MaderosW2red]